MLVEYKDNYEIKNLTTFKIGGNVKRLYIPKNQQELVYLLKELDNYIILGNCSDVLFSSNGYDGNVIVTTQVKDFYIRGTSVVAMCGVKGPLLSQKVCEAGLSGFEFMIGFPGTIGGEIYMNASAHGQCISDCLTQCCVYDKQKKEVVYLSKSDLCFSYRYSILQDGRYVLLGAEFDLKKQVVDEIKSLMDRNLETRRDIQPSLATPNAGSIFKNPENDSAGRLLDKAGVKELSCDNVQIWSKHANFIVNKGNAKSIDVLNMMYKMYCAVDDKFTIKLRPEVIFIGNKTKEEEQICKILYPKILK